MTQPTLTEIYNSIVTSLKNEFGISSENDLKRVLTALAVVQAGSLKLFYAGLTEIQKNMWPDLADSEQNGGTLERFGRLKLGRNPIPATQGGYTVTVTGVSGTTINAGVQLRNQTNGYIYTVQQSVTLSGTSGVIAILSDKPGVDYKLTVADELYFVNPIPNINSKGIVASETITPVDDEDIEDYRDKVIESFQLEPNGGSNADYLLWSLDVSSVRKVFPKTAGYGRANIYVEAYEQYSTDGNGTPTTAIMEALWKSDYTGVFEQDPDESKSLYERGRRPIGTELTILPIVPIPVIVTFTNLKDQSDAVKASIELSIKNAIYEIRPFVVGAGNINDRKDKLYYKTIISAVEAAIQAGNTYDDLNVTVDSIGLPYQFLDGNIPYLDSIVYE